MGNNITPESIETIEKDEKQTPQQVVQNKFDEKNYLNVKLNTEKGELSREIKIRILPIDSEENAPFKKVHMHYVKVNKHISDKGFKNYICIKRTEGIDKDTYGSKCPYCEIANDAWKKYNEATDPSEKTEWLNLFKANCSDEYGIIRCIERGHENEGPKFWKFRLRTDKLDAMNTILKLYHTRRNESIEEKYGTDFLKKPREEQEAIFEKDGFTPFNLLDIYEGKDLKLSLEAVYDKNGKLTDKVTVNITDYGSVKPISQNEDEIEQWINDTKKWSDVFTIKPYEYLKILSEGKSPYFDKKENKWVEWDEDFKNKQSNAEYNEVIDENDVPF